MEDKKEIQYGKCHCGCGGDAPIAKKTRPVRGQIAGEPLKYIFGHWARRYVAPYNGPVKLCECGCGQPAPIAKKTDGHYGHIKGHPVRFIRGHVAITKHKRIAAEPRLCACGCGKTTEKARFTNKKYGTIRGEYRKFLHGHRMRAVSTKEDLIKTFWSKVDIRGEDECWEWTRGKDNGGYGAFKMPGIGVRAHRIAFVLAGGNLNQEKNCVCHHCDNPTCCNPNHLFSGSKADNNKDRISKGRTGTNSRGEKHCNSKLKEYEVREILAQKGQKTQKELAAIYGVHQGTIHAIHARKNWKHIKVL